MKKGDVVVKVDDKIYPDGHLTVRAYFPFPGLAVHRTILSPLFSNKKKWTISHTASGLRIHYGSFRRLRDAFCACKMIADTLPWTSSADEILKASGHRRELAKFIIHYAIEGKDEAEIAQLILEKELSCGTS